MKKAVVFALVMVLGVAMVQADVVSDYKVKVVDSTPSYPLTSLPSRGGWPVGTATWGTSGGNFQLYFSETATWVPQTAICTYDGTTVTIGTISVPQIVGLGNHGSSMCTYNDYSTGNQLVRSWISINAGWGSDTNNPTWGGRFTNTYYSVATESTGVTFTTPTRVTIVNTSMMHLNPVGHTNSMTAPQTMLNGGYLSQDRDDMWDLCGYLTSLTALPADQWENIDESQDIGSWYTAYGQPDDDHYNWGEGGILRLCDNTIASPAASSSPWMAGGGGPGHGLWINTVSDSLPGNIPVWDGWRNDPNNTTTRSIDVMLLGESSYTSLAGANTRQGIYPTKGGTLALAPRQKDTATKFLALYTSAWPSWGMGYMKLMITKQAGDLNYDGKCDFADLPLFSATFNKSLGDAGYNGDADFDGNNKVDFSDLPGFSGAFGGQCN